VGLWPFTAYFIIVLILVGAMLGLSYVLGQRHDEPATGDPYESGIVSEGSAHVRVSVKFYLLAMFFVIFDLEAVFIFSWEVAGRDALAGGGQVCDFLYGPNPRRLLRGGHDFL